MEQVYLAPCTEYQYEPLKQAVDDIFDHLALNRFLFQGANVVIKPNAIPIPLLLHIHYWWLQ